MEQPYIHLEGIERWLMSQYRRRGSRGIVILVTVASVVISVLTTIASMEWMSGAEKPSSEEKMAYLTVAVLVPCVVAPLVISLMMRLLVKLDAALTIMGRLSTTDALTGSANRLGFFNSASQSLQALQSSKECLVAMVDLDQFKLLNDNYGHQIGDAALQLLAQRLAKVVGDLGVVGRIGGDEFALYLLCDASRLQQVQDQLHQECKVLALDGIATSSVTFSASVGVVQLEAGEDINDALGRADAQLYQCKRSRLRGSARN